MPDNLFKVLFMLGVILQETIRTPHRRRNARERRSKQLSQQRTRPLDFLLDLCAFAAMEILPFVYGLTPWLNSADYTVPFWAGWIGALILAVALWLLWRAQSDLGESWSPTLEIRKGHTLVTHGVYAYVRHPIYASLWLFALAQLLMLWNWIAGPAGLVAMALVYLIRVPREEQMMLDHFGEAYRTYQRQTGGVIPRLDRLAQLWPPRSTH